jgi:hypothetical protein
VQFHIKGREEKRGEKGIHHTCMKLVISAHEQN